MNIISKHHLTLTEALLGCEIKVHTISGDELVKVKTDDLLLQNSQITLTGKVYYTLSYTLIGCVRPC